MHIRLSFENPEKSSKMRPLLYEFQAELRRDFVNVSRAFLKSSNQWILTQMVSNESLASGL